MNFKLIFRILLATYFVLPTALFAGMGPAVAPKEKFPELTRKSFDGWCRKKYQDCTISIEGDSLVIDGSYRVNKNDIYLWSRADEFRQQSGFIGPHHLYTYEFRYKDEVGQSERGWVVFQESNASDAFYSSIKAWAGSAEQKCEYNFDARKVVCR